MTHPFHPLFGQELELVEQYQGWMESRVYFPGGGGHLRSIPVAFTDLGGRDPFVEAAQGRAYFRVADLVELTRLLRGLSGVAEPAQV